MGLATSTGPVEMAGEGGGRVAFNIVGYLGLDQAYIMDYTRDGQQWRAQLLLIGAPEQKPLCSSFPALPSGAQRECDAQA